MPHPRRNSEDLDYAYVWRFSSFSNKHDYIVSTQRSLKSSSYCGQISRVSRRRTERVFAHEWISNNLEPYIQIIMRLFFVEKYALFKSSFGLRTVCWHKTATCFRWSIGRLGLLEPKSLSRMLEVSRNVRNWQKPCKNRMLHCWYIASQRIFLPLVRRGKQQWNRMSDSYLVLMRPRIF